MGSSLANVGPYWQDDVGMSDSGYLGPVASAAGVGSVRGGKTWQRRFRHRQKLFPVAIDVAVTGPTAAVVLTAPAGSVATTTVAALPEIVLHQRVC
jgi:hypothetical protein